MVSDNPDLKDRVREIAEAEAKKARKLKCKHLRARILGNELTGTCTCPDCGEAVRLYVVFNNLLDAMREAAGIPDTDETG